MKIYKGVVALLFTLAGCACDPDAQLGREYLGRPYVPSPLGEGTGYDPDPLIRFDAFDCTTFVETVLANGDVNTLNQIRYANGHVDFVNRNHFIETDWIKNNADRVLDVTARIAPTTTRTVTIDRAQWMRRVHGIEITDAPETIDLEYISYDVLPQNFHPNRPLIVLFITDGDGMRAKIGTDLAVVHMGFLLPDGTLRHASSRASRVIDINFDEYVAMRKKSGHNLGVIFLGIK